MFDGQNNSFKAQNRNKKGKKYLAHFVDFFVLEHGKRDEEFLTKLVYVQNVRAQAYAFNLIFLVFVTQAFKDVILIYFVFSR